MRLPDDTRDRKALAGKEKDGLWFVGAIFLAFYPITRERHERNVAILEARRAEAVARTAEETPAAGAAL